MGNKIDPDARVFQWPNVETLPIVDYNQGRIFLFFPNMNRTIDCKYLLPCETAHIHQVKMLRNRDVLFVQYLKFLIDPVGMAS